MTHTHTHALAQGSPALWIGLALLLVAGLLLAARRRAWHRSAFALALLVAIFGVESAVHSVHHLWDPGAADSCAILSGSKHLDAASPSRSVLLPFLVLPLAQAACASPQTSADTGDAADAGPVTQLDVTSTMDAEAVDTTDAAVTLDAATPDASDSPIVSTDVVIPDATGTIRDVQHVVIFVQENRAFDHYFGTLAGVRGFADPSALQLQTGNTVFHQPNGTGELLPFHTALQCINDVDHGWGSGHTALNGGDWDRWVPAKGPTAMSSYARPDLPYYYALADAYTTLDAYHCSVMGPTNPNRMYLMTGMIDPNATGGGPAIDNRQPAAGFTWTTYPERLQTAGVTWKVYQALENYDDNALAWFRQYKNAAPGTPLYDRGMARTLDLVREFRNDVMADRLPQVSWIVASEPASEHPPYALATGQRLTQRLLEALAVNPTVANSTIFFLTFDENGGFYDHIAPPLPPAGTAAEFVSGAPIGLGNRVPTIAISPWSRGGVVDSQVFDHTSIIQFLERWTGVNEPNISVWRRQVTGDLTSVFDFAHPDYTVPMLPTVPAVTCSGSAPALPAVPAVPTQETGPRPARALPYQPNATSRTDCAMGRFYINMTNTGTSAVHYSIAANQFRTDGPWQYDVGPGVMLEDYFSVVTFGGGRYDLTAYGPNGFLRQYAGNIMVGCGELEVTSTLHPTAGTVDLTFVNHGGGSVTFTTMPTRYRTDGPRSTMVAAGGTQTQTWDVAAMGQGWYSLAVNVSSDAAFSRRFVGHLENGSMSITGQ